MKNKKGFTLVELIAVVIIIGILLGVAVPSTIYMMNRQKRKSFVEDGKKLISLAKATVQKDKTIEYPDRFPAATIINLAYMDSEDFGDSIYGVPYNLASSFVVILPKKEKNSNSMEGGKYNYYAVLMACKGDKYKPCAKTNMAYSISFKTLDDLSKKGSEKTVEYSNRDAKMFRYDLATKTVELDTVELTKRLKELTGSNVFNPNRPPRFFTKLK